MKAFLMHKNEDLDLEPGSRPNEEALIQDLELNMLFNAMALGDKFLSYVARIAILSSLTDPGAIGYRQQVLADCLAQPAIVREIYGIVVEAIEAERKIWGWGMSSPDSILHKSVQVMELFVGFLKRLRVIAVEHGGEFSSEGFTRLFAMLASELDDEYFRTVEDHLKQLAFRRGVLISAELGKGNKGVHHVLRRLPRPQTWMERIMRRSRSGYTFEIAPRDDNGFAALTEIRGKGINLVANALAQSANHILSFLSMLRAELAFYVGCLNLHERLSEKGEPTCFPVALPPGRTAFSAQGLYDACLSLHLEERVVGNDVQADARSLVMITGANQGGKSTFLRSVGLAQLMMQSGMFVAAESFGADVCDGIFTHFKREEDATMESGKLDEELSRMSDIADVVTPNCIVLCNESFAATNEREGSEIARQVVRALVEAGIKVFFVTHLFDLANGFYLQDLDTTLFLRAERQPDGRRTFRIVEGHPLPTSYGEDSYRRIFGTPDAPAAVADMRP
jgi:DNA mismatch repair ATPase MutS